MIQGCKPDAVIVGDNGRAEPIDAFHLCPSRGRLTTEAVRPRWLSFPALLVGTVAPDLAYLFANKQIDEVAHRALGVFLFSLPAGLMTVWFLRRLGRLLIPSVPGPFSRVLSPLVAQPLGSGMAVICSLLIGAGTHVFWDSFTHKDGWLVQHFAILQQPLPLPGKRTARVCHLLWYLSTLGGVTWLAIAYQRWRGIVHGGPGELSAPAKWWNALWLGALMMALGLVHHLFQETLLAGVGSVLLMAWFVWRVEKPFEQKGRKPPASVST